MKPTRRRLATTNCIIAALLTIGAAAHAADEAADGSAAQPVVAWLGVELTDIGSGDTFTLAQYADKPILLETFAIWCPTCTSQQRQLAALHEEVGDDVISVSLNTDPNESESHVTRHLSRYGFDWLYAVSPVELSRALRDEFGVAVLNPPSAPVILICPGQTERTLLSKRGVKRPDFLQEQIAACPAVDADGSASA